MGQRIACSVLGSRVQEIQLLRMGVPARIRGGGFPPHTVRSWGQGWKSSSMKQQLAFGVSGEAEHS